MGNNTDGFVCLVFALVLGGASYVLFDDPTPGLLFLLTFLVLYVADGICARLSSTRDGLSRELAEIKNELREIREEHQPALRVDVERDGG